MTDIINLRTARKAKKRALAEQAAAANRGKHGRTKAEKQRAALEQARDAKLIDGHLLRDEGDS